MDMNSKLINEIAANLNISRKQIETVLTMLDEGNTVPFIARYRKEQTGALDEEQIRDINKEYEYNVNLLKRKEDVIRLIDEKGLLTEELEQEIMKAEKLVDVEDLYRPFLLHPFQKLQYFFVNLILKHKAVNQFHCYSFGKWHSYLLCRNSKYFLWLFFHCCL